MRKNDLKIALSMYEKTGEKWLFSMYDYNWE